MIYDPKYRWLLFGQLSYSNHFWPCIGTVFELIGYQTIYSKPLFWKTKLLIISLHDFVDRHIWPFFLVFSSSPNCIDTLDKKFCNKYRALEETLEKNSTLRVFKAFSQGQNNISSDILRCMFFFLKFNSNWYRNLVLLTQQYQNIKPHFMYILKILFHT